jgi:hypothetical protein
LSHRERVCEGDVMCKVKVFEVWIVVELGSVAKENYTKANTRK